MEPRRRDRKRCGTGIGGVAGRIGGSLLRCANYGAVTGSGWYLGGVAGAAGLALSEDGRTLYVSISERCVWTVDTDARELTAGGKHCGSFVSGLPGYPGALALDEDGTLYISYRWTRSGWLENTRTAPSAGHRSAGR